jgi:hypothetical protein
VIFDLEIAELLKVMRHRRVHPTVFDNWYVHCPKCGGLLIRRMGSGGPVFVCLCPGRPAPAVVGSR